MSDEDRKCRNCGNIKKDVGMRRWTCSECDTINIVGEKV